MINKKVKRLLFFSKGKYSIDLLICGKIIIKRRFLVESMISCIFAITVLTTLPVRSAYQGESFAFMNIPSFQTM